MDTFGQRLKKLLALKDLTQSELSRLSGVSKSSISHYLKGDWTAKQDSIYAIAQATSVDEAWLMGYDVPISKHASLNIPEGFEPLPKLSQVPLIGSIACGQPVTAEENIEDIVSVPSKWHADFTLHCKGDSMEPRIHDGDLVAIRKQPIVENGEIAAVRIDCEATLKHVYLYPDRMVLQPENQAYAPIVLVGDEMDTVQIEGKAVGLCRGL